uniref:Neprosin PEP catalytic domain-containing protein n=1 Tax=Leersia perrieri TaxID=77586 RepID=A0A0D9VM19_9ORYZ
MKANNIFRVTLLSYLLMTIGGKEVKTITSGANSLIHTSQQVNKAIKTEDGDVYNCVDMYQQPTFKHPLLKDHKIQMEPSSFPIGMDVESPLVDTVSYAQLSTIDCPVGTIPILRDNKVDITMEQHIGMLASDNVQELDAGITYRDEIYGTRASINVYEPKVKNDSKDYSSSWIQIGYVPEGSNVVGIGAGSCVYPSFNRDSYARFHISWVNEQLNKSCTNHNCPGFVQVSPSIGIGGRIQPISLYKGPQYVIDVLIFKDPKTKNWWLSYGSNNTPIGYWPSSQFSYIKEKGNFAFWGGFVQGPTASSDSPQMGSGHFASEGFGKAAFVRNILAIKDGSNMLVTPNVRRSYPRSDDLRSYGVDGFGLNDDGMHVYYGGPGKYD